MHVSHGGDMTDGFLRLKEADKGGGGVTVLKSRTLRTLRVFPGT